MKKNMWKKTLVAAVLTGSAALGLAACETPEEKYTEVSDEMVQQWVKDLHTVYPFANFEVISLEKQNNKIEATISAHGNARGLDEAMLILTGLADSEIKLVVENGLVTEGGKKGIARIHWDVSVGEDASDDLIELYGTGLIRQCDGIVTAKGDVDATCKPAKSLALEENDNIFSLPAYTAVIQTSEAGTLLRTNVNIPSIAYEENSRYRGQSSIKATNLVASQKDKPLRSEFYTLSGYSDFSVDKIEFQGNEGNAHELNNFKYFENGNVDAKGLYQGKFGFSGNGTTSLAKEILDDRERKADQFSFEVEGDAANLHARSLMLLIPQFYGLQTQDESALKEGAREPEKEILLHAPQVNIHKMNITLNGHKGHMSFKAGLAPITVEELDVEPAILFANKTYVNASMDLPAQWLDNLGSEYKMTAELFLGQVVDEGYLIRKGDRYTSTLVYEKGSLQVNGKPVSWLKGMF